MAIPESDIAALYGLPLAEFTSARNELASQARAQGDAQEAERIRSLQKPTLPAWVLNMLARLRTDQLEELLQAGERAEAAQARLLAGDGDPAELNEAREDLVRSARTLAAEAGEILVKGGHAARQQTLLRVTRAVEAAAVTDEGRDRLRRGELAEEPQPTGFDHYLQLPAPAPRKRAGDRRTDSRKAARAALELARGELEARRAERSSAEQATREAEREARRKEHETERAWALVEESRQHAQRAEAAEREARQQLEAAEERVQRARGG